MSKHYHTCLIAFVSILAVGLTVSIAPQTRTSGQGFSLGVTTAMAEDDSEHHYGSDGYDEDGHDSDGYDRDGYDHDGYTRDGYRCDRTYDSDHDRDRATTNPTSGTAQSFVVKPTVKQY